jgi:hypothetical protein
MALAAVHVQERRDRHSEAARTSGHLESEFARAGRAESGPSRQAKRYAHKPKGPLMHRNLPVRFPPCPIPSEEAQLNVYGHLRTLVNMDV